MEGRQLMPCRRHHQQSAVPKGDDECPTFAGESARPFAPLDAPAVGPVDEPYIAMGDPAGDPPDQLAANKTPPDVGLGESQRHAATGARPDDGRRSRSGVTLRFAKPDVWRR